MSCQRSLLFSVPLTKHIMSSGGDNTQCKKVQVGKDQEKAQSENDSHSKNRGGKKTN